MPDRIAIVGIGGVFPGASELNAFWQNIVAGKDTAIVVNDDRWQLPLNEIYAPHLSQDKINSDKACLICDFQFDSTDFAVSADLLQQLDPAYQILLHAGRDAWQDANTASLDRARVGIIMGNIVLPTTAASQFSDELFKQIFEQQLSIKTTPRHIEPLNRYAAGLPAGLLAKALGIRGGAYTLDAACAASLYSLKYAVDALLAKRCDAMLAGGLARPDCLYTQMGFSQLNAISKSGRCAPFDKKADGLVIGEGAGIFVLKRLPDAIEQNDHIYATIEAIGLSNDIAGNIMSPDTEGQLRAMQAAYQAAGWSPADVQHIECHGTGTPIGDEIEFKSLTQLWQRHNASGDCVIGSVKSNVGHLLTAAGAAALMKTLLALRHQVLPPTAHFEQAAAKINMQDSPFRCLQKPETWTTSENRPRRAAISGFGFGGINAHVLLQEYKTEKYTAPSIAQPAAPAIAIIGMETRVGAVDNQNAFSEAVFSGAYDGVRFDKELLLEHPDLTACSVDEINISSEKYRIPPTELREMLPQQLLMLEVAKNALADAGLDELKPEQQLRSGVFIGLGLDMNTTNFHFRWMQPKYARDWRQRSGASLDDTDLDEWIEHLKTACGPALNANRTMGALGGLTASRIARVFRIGGPAFTVSAEAASGLYALQAAVRALQQHELDLVIVGAVDFACDIRSIKAALDYQSFDCVADVATALVLKRHKDALGDRDKCYALINGIGCASSGTGDLLPDIASQNLAAQNACADAGIFPDSIERVFDAKERNQPALSPMQKQHNFLSMYTGAAHGLLNLSGVVSALAHRILPSEKKGAACYWLKDRITGPRQAMANSTGIDGNSVSVILQEATTRAKASISPAKLLTVSAPNKALLIDQLQSLQYKDDAATQHAQPMRAAIIANNEHELRLAVRDAVAAIYNNECIDNGHCFHSPEPLAENGQIAFVYPGSGNHFYGMGQDLSVAFSHILNKLDGENEQLAAQFAHSRFWSDGDFQHLSHQEIILAQVWLGAFISDIVTSFGIKPDAIIGYSLGETAGLFSTRTWTQRDEMLQRIQKSDLFTNVLTGQCIAAQQTWGTTEKIDWATGVIYGCADDIKPVLSHYDRVYLLIINTPNECVIGGDYQQLNACINELGLLFHPLSGITTVHCEVAKTVQDAYRELHLFETNPPDNIRFYSGIYGKAYTVTRDSAADSILGQALHYFDYNKVIENAYRDGVRMFVEIGPGGSCTRMIGQILGTRPHYKKALCVKGQDSVAHILQLAARLYVEGIDVDLAELVNIDKKPNEGAQNMMQIKTGRVPFDVPLPLAPDVQKRKAEPVALPIEKKQAFADELRLTLEAGAKTQSTFLRLRRAMFDTMATAIELQLRVAHSGNVDGVYTDSLLADSATDDANGKNLRYLFDRNACLQFARGAIGSLLGAQFADIDQYPTRVRLPDEPLMLVDRILSIEGQPDSMTNGQVVTEHDILQDAWYLDLGRIPTCIAVEAGQADLLLSAYLGIDHMTHGLAMYRLLDARITFHRPLPKAGETIRYDIHIDHFFKQGKTWLFHFHFEGSVNGDPLLTMTDGCAGFFTQAELDAGRGIVLSKFEQQSGQGVLTGGYQPLVAMQTEHYSDSQLNQLRSGDLPGCFGRYFYQLRYGQFVTLPNDKMNLVHRILNLDPNGGQFGIGQITGEADIHPDDWFLTCHFMDDKVMPGTLMYECCLHTLRIYLLRMGWVGALGEYVYEPVPGEVSQLKCRGQVVETTKTVQYEITLKEIGYQNNGTPYALANALIYADHHAIVQIKNMSVRLTGLTKEKLQSRWQKEGAACEKQVLFDSASILAFATGNPSEAFGDRYSIFDQKRKIARLPAPPYQFLDRIISIKNCTQWVLNAGGVIEAEYDVPADAWYFRDNNQPVMPFAVLLEVALQPCGWLAAYLGSALTSDTDLSFRNLGGKATQYMDVLPEIGTLTTKVEITHVSQSGGMVIQNFNYTMTSAMGLVYSGNTYFGFFSKKALAVQAGIRDASWYVPDDDEYKRTQSIVYPNIKPMPTGMLRMVDEITIYKQDNSRRKNLGYIEGCVAVNPDAWFFKAHFYQDPVWPGSLGLESFQQLLKFFALNHWQGQLNANNWRFESIALNQTHQWTYRGQILPSDKKVNVQAVITAIDDQSKTITATGYLSVDGRIIYQMKDFAVRIA